MRLGELCAGYNGLGMAVEEVFGAESAWFSEYDAAPSKILAHHYPNVPNYGDMTRIDWAAIEHVDIISGGTPCQDLSAAGKRAGMTDGTRSNLWVQMREAIAIQEPRYVVWENVRGAYSATAASDLEQCPGCLGDTTDGRAVLRALGRVLGDLSDLGYDTQWRGLRAADVGACHGRFRVFILAQNPNLAVGGERRLSAPGQTESGRARADTGGRDRTPTADTSGPRTGVHTGTSGQAWEQARTRGAALVSPRDWEAIAEGHRPSSGESTPNPNGGDDDGRLGNQEWRQERGETTTRAREGLHTVTDPSRSRFNRRADLQGEGWDQGLWGEEIHHPSDGDTPRHNTNWGDYTPAIARWESVMGRRSPAPTEPTGRNAGHRLSPRFTEWMMGLPDGWVTDPAIGISRNDQLKACGNGVVPQQAAAALRDMLAAFQQQEVAA